MIGQHPEVARHRIHVVDPDDRLVHEVARLELAARSEWVIDSEHCHARVRDSGSHSVHAREDAFRALSEPAPIDELPPAPTGPPNPDFVATMTARFADCGVEFAGSPLPVLLAAH